MIRTIDVAWAAGFLEGEGSFGYSGTARVSAAQVQKEPIDRLVSLFGGRTYLRETRGFSTLPIWVWQLDARKSIQVMMTLYALMSPKRRDEIERALAKWKLARRMRIPGTGTCAHGHEMAGYNVITVNGYTRCRECMKIGKRRRRLALAA